ncbi:hypothetical protein BU14_0262s0006 [Porphyra umbilicalis]|uniref:Uncharacterized protein n=1 Tax=Porphyra umbilicalis TaxID=2786 RepID=A0A1X6P1Y5_PORUM|nr:hypothetical protein BU14_0262s0006 [Porphyra umbilicalis]|eukprot:OSX74889.1 hypothetical protein BU14_0262s0006 [Porphyra umbilicalis]
MVTQVPDLSSSDSGAVSAPSSSSRPPPPPPPTARKSRSSGGAAKGGAPRRAPKRPWTAAEDEALRRPVSVYGTTSWSRIAADMGDRNGKQCRERWFHQLNPAIFRGSWSPDEDASLLSLQRQHGNAWATIARSLPGRTGNQVKNRFNTIRKCRVTATGQQRLYPQGTGGVGGGGHHPLRQPPSGSLRTATR